MSWRRRAFFSACWREASVRLDAHARPQLQRGWATQWLCAVTANSRFGIASIAKRLEKQLAPADACCTCFDETAVPCATHCCHCVL